MRVLVLHSGAGDGVRADEHDTLVQLAEISGLLAGLGHGVDTLPFSGTLGQVERRIKRRSPDFVFNLVEAVEGTDRLSYTAAALLDFLGLPYSGCPSAALAILSTKSAQKRLLRAAGLPTPALFTDGDPADGHTYIVKSDTEHASFGIGDGSVVSGSSLASERARQRAAEHGGRWLVERYIDGREFNVSMLDDGRGGVAVLPPAEMLFEGYLRDQARVVDYDAKWTPSSISFQATRRSFEFDSGDRMLLKRITGSARRCWSLFGLAGAARVDYRVDDRGRSWILEVNANPCLASDAGLMAAAAEAGITSPEVVRRLCH